jgi:nitrogen fixation-related uncharacterized protein
MFLKIMFKETDDKRQASRILNDQEDGQPSMRQDYKVLLRLACREVASYAFLYGVSNGGIAEEKSNLQEICMLEEEELLM